MNRILKNIYVILATIVLMLGAAFVATKEPSAPPHFRIQNEFGQQNISIFNAQDGNYYVFLPSYAKLEQVQAVLPHGQSIYLDDIRLTDQMTCEIFELEKPYYFSMDGNEDATLWFYQSQNVAAMYIDTVSGEMTDIHNDKDYEEYASMTLYSPDGRLNHFDGSSRLKGRGNSTWDQNKRPYLLKLSSDGDLLGMGSGKKWVLLANAYDETNLNNKLVFDLASQVGFSWSPDSRFVDLYLNGEYRGLYLLTEKIEISANRLDLDTNSGEFLCKVDTWDRRVDLQYYFESSMGRIIEICSDDALSAEDFDYITYLIYLMEEEFSSGADLTDSGILDLDSWIRRYLIDEISGNIDSDLTSSYFYYSDGKFFAGPVWDYDMAFGNHYRNQESWAFIAKNAWKRNTRPSPYYSHLYANESFYRRMTEIYRTEFVPILQEMIDHGIDDQIQQIRSASQMNSIRWNPMYDYWNEVMMGLDVVQDSAALKAYFTRRIQFLDSAWLDQKDYCTVQFESEPGDAYWNISVEKGSCLETSYMNLVDSVWLDMETGVPVDFQSPIMQDLVVTRQLQTTEDASVSEEEITEQEEVPPSASDRFFDSKMILILGVFFALFLLLWLWDTSRSRRKGSE